MESHEAHSVAKKSMESKQNIFCIISKSLIKCMLQIRNGDKPFETFQQPFTFALTETAHVIALMYVR